MIHTIVTAFEGPIARSIHKVDVITVQFLDTILAQRGANHRWIPPPRPLGRAGGAKHPPPDYFLNVNPYRGQGHGSAAPRAIIQKYCERGSRE